MEFHGVVKTCMELCGVVKTCMEFHGVVKTRVVTVRKFSQRLIELMSHTGYNGITVSSFP